MSQDAGRPTGPPAVRPLGSGGRLHGFQDLSRYRIHDILLVSTVYDAFILTEDGQLSESVLRRFLSFDAYHAPRLWHAATGADALALATRERRFDLVITAAHVGDMRADAIARALAARDPHPPVVVLAYDPRDVDDPAALAAAGIEHVFLWQGDVGILPAIVKLVEDRLNVAEDTGTMGVQAIILIEDNVRYYSSFLPVIYAELLRHSQSLVPEGLNLSQKLLRLQARPKILLCRTYEEAWRDFTAYGANVLGVIADIEFARGGARDPLAGVDFARRVRELQPDVPVMLQSGARENAAEAAAVGATFLYKDSPTLLHEVQRFMIEQFGFGDFVFRRPDGSEVSRARDLRGLEDELHTVPPESLAYHADRNHFSRWLKARTEFAVAYRLRPRKLSDFATIEELRQDLIQSIHDYRREQNRGIVADFEPATFDADAGFSRIGGGSLGGKGRGLAFGSFLLEAYGLSSRFPGVAIAVPPGIVLGTEVFDRVLDSNGLRDAAIRSTDERELLARFLAARMPDDVLRDLSAFLERARYPLAVRSSSLLEDSPSLPFAGVYETYMLANRHPDVRVRLERLLEAIGRVYVSMFGRHAKAYLESTPYRLEEEKMAIVIQKVVGRPRGDRYYPDLAGVARSHHAYAVPPLRASDGVAAVALGLGTAVVGGEPCFRFSPRHPRHLLQFSTVQDVLANSQRAFYALRLDDAGERQPTEDFALAQYGLDVAERDGALVSVGSTYSAENDAIFDGIGRPGPRLVTFAPILKHRVFPLAEILAAVLELAEQASGGPVEIEFAATATPWRGQPPEFALLQLRPLALTREFAELDVGRYSDLSLVCRSSSVLGHGRIDDVRDLVVIDSTRFGSARSQELAAALGRINASLADAGRPYILIGVGRFGSSEPTLGLPVQWDQISGARVVVEAGFRDFRVTPSQGSHFFHHLMTFNVGYFTVNPERGEGFVDWDWLAAQPAAGEEAGVRHVRVERPFVVEMNGRDHQGVIAKPRDG
ncbi:MAG: PEP/pyruvate-binding domain-containing protein [Acidobacteriota bacterium]